MRSNETLQICQWLNHAGNFSQRGLASATGATRSFLQRNRDIISERPAVRNRIGSSWTPTEEEFLLLARSYSIPYNRIGEILGRTYDSCEIKFRRLTA